MLHGDRNGCTTTLKAYPSFQALAICSMVKKSVGKKISIHLLNLRKFGSAYNHQECTLSILGAKKQTGHHSYELKDGK